MQQFTGIRREDAIGNRCSEVLRANIRADGCVMRSVPGTGEPAVNASVIVVVARGARIPIKASAAVLRDIDGQVIGGVETFQNFRQGQAGTLRSDPKRRRFAGVRFARPSPGCSTSCHTFPTATRPS